MKEGTFIGFDFGTKYLGIAVGQSITQDARPLTVLQVQQGVPDWEQLAKIIEEWQPRGLIIGLALQLDNSPSPTSLAAQKFGQRIKAHFNLPVYYIDERLTTVAARERAKTTPRRLQQRDAIAAAIILENWLNDQYKEKCQGVSNSTAI